MLPNRQPEGTGTPSQGTLRLVSVIVIVIVVVAGLSAYVFLTTSSLSKQNSSLAERISSQDQQIANLNGLVSIVEYRAVQNSISYLASQYDPHVGLLSEAPHSDAFWIYSDNYLAVLALRQAYRTNSTVSAIVKNISATMARLSGPLGGAASQYMALNSTWDGPCIFNSSVDYTILHDHDIRIAASLNNGTGVLSPTDFADIAFLQAICHEDRGDYEGWSQAFNQGGSLFQGVGFNDSAFQRGASAGIFQTYKLALYLIASESLCQVPYPAQYQWALTTLLELQAPNGGFHTGYNPNLSVNGTTNTETTSLALFAMTKISVCLS